MVKMNELIDEMVELLTPLTKEESDFIESVFNWDSDKRACFMIAKRMESKKDGW